MGGEVSRDQRPGSGKASRWEAGARATRSRDGENVLPLAVRQRLWDQLWQRLLAPLPAAAQQDADGEGR